MPSRTIGDVQKTVLAQHAEIRAGLRWLVTLANGTRTARSAERVLRNSLLRFTALFGAHLDFEERELAPSIRELDAWGPVREASMRAEHAVQRTRLAQVCMLADPSSSESESPTRMDLDREVLQLVSDLFLDMTEEESLLAELAELEELGPGDQMTG